MNEQTSRTARAEAAAWLAKLHGPERTDTLEGDFRAWLNATRENTRAFEHITEVWDDLGRVNTAGLPRPARNEPVSRASRRVFVSIAAAATLLLAIGALLADHLHLYPFGLPTYTTGIGEQRTVQLDDGTRLSLNSDTRLVVAYTKSRRYISLARGETYFEVAKDPARPLSVAAAGKTITALGTSFSVKINNAAGTPASHTLLADRKGDAPSIQVAVTDGTVQITNSARSEQPHSSAAGSEQGRQQNSALVLSAGDIAHINDAGIKEEKRQTPQLEQALGWRRGEVILDNTPLADAVAEMNRYQKRQLILDVPESSLTVSGIYRTGDSEGFARAVANVYDLQVEVSPGEIHLAIR